MDADFKTWIHEKLMDKFDDMSTQDSIEFIERVEGWGVSDLRPTIEEMKGIVRGEWQADPELFTMMKHPKWL